MNLITVKIIKIKTNQTKKKQKKIPQWKKLDGKQK